MIACMGGGCASRDRCANYYATTYPVDRLCGPTEEPEFIRGNVCGGIGYVQGRAVENSAGSAVNTVWESSTTVRATA